MSAERCPRCDRPWCSRWAWAVEYAAAQGVAVEDAMDACAGSRDDLDSCTRNRHDWRAEALALRVKARLTVGAALAIGNVIEFQASWTDDLTWIQIKCGERWRMWRTRAGESWWSMWTTPLNLDGVDRARPARLVPLSLADLDPATRGEMP